MNELRWCVRELLQSLDEWHEQVVPINRESAMIRDLRKEYEAASTNVDASAMCAIEVGDEGKAFEAWWREQDAGLSAAFKFAAWNAWLERSKRV